MRNLSRSRPAVASTRVRSRFLQPWTDWTALTSRAAATTRARVVYDSNSLLGAEETYTRWNAVLSAPVTIGRHTVEGLIAGGNRIGSNPVPVYDQFELGGFLNLSGLSRAQLRADRFVFGRLIYRSQVANLPVVQDVHVGVSLEGARLNPAIPIWRGQAVSGDLNVYAGSVFMGIDSPLGPLYLGFGYANSDNKAVYLYLGRP